MMKGTKEKFLFINQIFDDYQLLLAAFYHLTYQYDSKDFNICNYKQIIVPICTLLKPVLQLCHGLFYIFIRPIFLFISL